MTTVFLPFGIIAATSHPGSNIGIDPAQTVVNVLVVIVLASWSIST